MIYEFSETRTNEENRNALELREISIKRINQLKQQISTDFARHQ